MSRIKLWSRRMAWLLGLWTGSVTAFIALAYALHTAVQLMA